MLQTPSGAYRFAILKAEAANIFNRLVGVPPV